MRPTAESVRSARMEMGLPALGAAPFGEVTHTESPESRAYAALLLSPFVAVAALIFTLCALTGFRHALNAIGLGVYIMIYTIVPAYLLILVFGLPTLTMLLCKRWTAWWQVLLCGLLAGLAGALALGGVMGMGFRQSHELLLMSLPSTVSVSLFVWFFGIRARRRRNV